MSKVFKQYIDNLNKVKIEQIFFFYKNSIQLCYDDV